MIDSPVRATPIAPPAVERLRVVTVIPDTESVIFVRAMPEKTGTVEHEYVWISAASHRRLNSVLTRYTSLLIISGDYPRAIYAVNHPTW